METKTFKPMLAKQYHKHRAKVAFPCSVQPKCNGYRMLWDGGSATSREGLDTLTVPDAVLEALESWGAVDGELYRHGMAFDTIGAALRTHGWTEPLDRIQYWVFDQPTNDTFGNRSSSLAIKHATEQVRWEATHTEPYPIVLVPTWTAHTAEDIDRLQAQSLADGYEGAVVRNTASPYQGKRTTDLLKYKPVTSATYIVVGMTEGKGKYAGQMGALTLMAANGQEYAVGSGFTDDDRKTIWAGELGWLAGIEYQEATPDGRPLFPAYTGPVTPTPEHDSLLALYDAEEIFWMGGYVEATVD